MPELPEVETIKRGLAPRLEGQRIEAVTLNRRDLRLPFPQNFAARLTGTRIGILARRAKYMLIPLDSAQTLIVHLGMSGRPLVETADESRNALSPGAFFQAFGRYKQHDHVVMHLSSGDRFIYNDTRRFGFMLLEPDIGLSMLPTFADMGPEPLGNAFNAEVLLTALKARAAPIKSTLLDQHIVAGLGNIYVCEALHRAGISPFRAARSVSLVEATRLVQEIRDVLNEAIVAGGSTLRDFRNEEGAPGYFQHDFRVYGRQGSACPAPGCSGKIERQVQSGRSTFFCSLCQH